jgi:hypothetical protein
LNEANVLVGRVRAPPVAFLEVDLHGETVEDAVLGQRECPVSLFSTGYPERSGEASCVFLKADRNTDRVLALVA